MKKRVLSMLLAFILCFSTLPMTAFAQEVVQEADVVTEQAGPAAEQEEQQQEEAEAAAAPGAETPADKSTTAAAPGTEDSTVGEATDTVKPTGESVSGSDVGTQDTAENGEKAAEVQVVQKLIDALPETVTVENAESIGEQLAAIDEAMESLTEEQIAELDMEHLYAISEAMSAPMTVAEGEHRHPVCGETCTDGDEHEAVTWTPISELTNDMAAGNYYLTEDIILTDKDGNNGNWVLKNDINLCLNGHTITLKDNQIMIWEKLSLCNCSTETKTVSCANGITIAYDGEFQLYDNVQITNPQRHGVIIRGAKFIMYGGTISGCSDMAVHVDSSSTFEMKGGEIRNNSSSLSYRGGGVDVYGTFIVSGTAKVTGNTANGATSNVYLQSGAKMIVGDAGLKDGASIGVTLYKYPNDGGSVTIATGKIEGSSKYFSADAGDPYGVMEQDGELVLKNGVPHMHPVCGTTCEDGEKHDSVEWTGISSLNEITEDGNYYLKNDISDVGYYWKLKYDINLCLNGHSIKTDDNKDCYIDVNASNTLSLCNPHEKAASCIGVWVGDKCKFNLYGNVVITRKNNSGVWINDGGTFTMNGGTICNSGCGVVVYNNATFIMNNGRITENTMINYGGGGGVCVYAGGNFTMTGGEISKNTATAYGGGVYVDFNTSQLKSGTFTVSGNAKIIDNKVGNSKNNVALCDGSKITIAESGLGNDASIGVSLKKDITEGSYAVIASGLDHGYTIDTITSDRFAYKMQQVDDELILYSRSTSLHTHPVCGKECTHTGEDAHGTLIWQGISSLDEIKEPGNYYLNNDISLSKFWEVPCDINLCLNGYQIKNTAGSDYRGYLIHMENKKLSLCNCNTIPVDKSVLNGGVFISGSDSQLDLYRNVKIINSIDTTWPNKSVVWVYGGKFTMYGGTVSGDNKYGGIYVTIKGTSWDTSGTFVMKDGTITGNSGAGVTVYGGSTVIMDGGTITGNVNGSNGGGVCVGYGTFTMNGGTISGNTSYSNGGGVYVDDASSKFIMNGGTISNNKTTIRPGNSKPSSGGGVYVGYGKFIMNDGTIENNEAESFGGGIVVAKKGSFDMSGGTITDNKCTSLGSGVYLESNGTFTMKGGSITKNRTKYYTYAGGVYVAEGSKFAVSGTVNITENTRDYGGINMAENVYLQGEAENPTTITIGAGLSEASRIGVSKADYTIYGGKKIKIATGAETGVDYTKIFTADAKDAEYLITRDDEGNVYLGTHQHSWVYKANGAVITAECSGCDAEGGSVTIKAPTDLTYNGKSKEAMLEDSLTTGETVSDLDISYRKGESLNGELPTGSYPTDAGTYTASITVGGVTAGVTYTIAKAAPQASDFTFTAPSGSLTYDGNAKTATVAEKSSIKGMGSVTVKYYQDEKEVQEPINAGTYKVKIDVTAGINYNAVNSLTSDDWTFTIARNNTQPTVEWSGNTTYTYTGEQITPEVTVKVGDTTLVKGTDYTIAYGANTTAGKDAGKVTIQAKGNYGFTDVVKNFDIEKADPKLSFGESTVTKTYIDKPFSNLPIQVGDGTVTYSSSNTNVATVNKTTGEVTIVGVGTATITATAAATTNYKERSASYTLTVNKALLVVNGAPVVQDKYYDGTADAVVTVSFADGNNALLKLKPTTDYTVTGTFSSPNASTSKQEVSIKIELKGDYAKNYELKEDTYTAYAYINAKPISIVSATAVGREYVKDNRSVTISSVEFDDVVTSLVKDTDYTVTGEMADADAGTNKEVTVKVTLSGDAATNYNLSDTMPTTTVDISQATAEIAGATTQRIMKNGVEVDISKWVSFNNTDSKAELEYELLYSPAGITLNGSKLTAANNDTTVESFAIKVTAKETPNFTSAEKTITVDVVDKMPVGIIFKEPVKSNTVYGDPDFSLTADFDPKGTVPAKDDNGTWEWKSSNPDVLEIISGGDTTTPTIKVLKAGRSFLTVTYTSDTYSGGPNGVSITVNPKAITADMIGNIDAQEYTGKDIKPTPEVKDGTTKLTNDTDFEYSYSNNTNAGTATLTITGKGNYEGEVTKKFTISPKSIDGVSIELANKSFAYTGSEQTVNITSVKLSDGTILGTDDYVIKDNSNKATNAGEITLTIEGKGNYTGTATTTWAITKAVPKLADFDVVPDLSNELTYSGEEQIVNVTTKARGMGMITVRYNGSTEKPVNVGNYAITIDVADGSNYKAISGIEAGTLTIKKAAAPTLADVKVDHAYATTGNQTVSLAELVKSAKSYTPGEITGNTETEILSDINVTGDGVLQYTLTGKGAAGSTVTIPVTIASTNYEETTVNVVITIKQATPTGAPGYDFVHDSSKTLKDAGLDLINSTLNPKEGTLEWIDSNGKVLPGETKLEEGKKYIWRFTPDDPNYAVITGEVELYAPYRILDGADSTWTQSTDGTIAIRGNGDFEKFQSVKVDGVVVDAKNYTVAKGSTIITFKEDYLKTLSTGSHTFELVWTDGSATTKFTIAAKADNGDNNNSDNNNNDKNDDSDNDTVVIGNVSSGNNTVPAVIGAPKTGDASGIWMTLFAVSLAGLAAMLVRKKNNRE